jgi:hypothetical protein
VPIEEAVEKGIRDYVKKIRLSQPVYDAFMADGIRYNTSTFVNKLQQTRVNGGPVDRSKIEEIFRYINKLEEEDGRSLWKDDKLNSIKAALDNENKMEMFLRRCAEPMVRAELGDSHAATALEVLIDAGELKTLLGLAVKQEKEQCSWETTIGPAVKAIKRLGRTSAGKDMERLAEYAKAHQKPVAV